MTCWDRMVQERSLSCVFLLLLWVLMRRMQINGLNLRRNVYEIRKIIGYLPQEYLLIGKTVFKQQIHPILPAMQDAGNEKFVFTDSIKDDIWLHHDTAISRLD